MKKIFSISFFVLLFTCSVTLFAQNRSQQQLLQLKIFHLENPEQEQKLDRYLEEAYLPALARTGIKPVGVFKPLGQDTTADRRIYLLIPFDSFSGFESLTPDLMRDKQYRKDAAEFIDIPSEETFYTSIETIIMRAFSHAPQVQAPDLNAPRSERVYELRSYGSATEALNINKVEMFNEGGEVDIFSRLGFNAIFYGNVLAGSEMPNLMYMTSFENMESRNTHWDTFRSDSQWEELSSVKKYQDNVSWIEITFLRPADYSDL